MKKKTTILLFAASLFSIGTITLGSCGGNPNNGDNSSAASVSKTITISETSTSIKVGEEKQLTATTGDSEQDSLYIFTWSSSNKEVATCKKGLLVGISTGECTITVTVRTQSLKTVGSAECSVKVVSGTLAISDVSVDLYLDGVNTHILTIDGKDSANVDWSSSNESVVTVDKGVLTGKGEGSATITATADGLSATCAVTVHASYVSVESTKYVKVGEESPIGITGTLKSPTYSTSDPSIATVENGSVKGLASGMAEITIKDGDDEYKTVVIVTTGDEEKSELKTGKKSDSAKDFGNWYYLLESETATVKEIPTMQNGLIDLKITHVGKADEPLEDGTVSGANMVYLRYQPDETGNIVYDEILYMYSDGAGEIQVNGISYSVKKGLNKITTEFTSSKISEASPAQIKFRMAANFLIIPQFVSKGEVKSLKLNETRKTLTLGSEETFKLSATLGDESVICAFSSSDETIATVDENGLVTAKAVGTAKINAIYENYSAECSIEVIGNETPAKNYLKENGQKSTVAADPGNWYYLNDSDGLFEDYPYFDEDGTIVANVVGVGSGKFPMLRYQPDDVGGIDYKVTVDINTSSAATVDIGSLSKKELAEGDNHIELDYTSVAPSNASPFQVKFRSLSKFRIKISFVKVETPVTADPKVTLSDKTKTIDLKDSSTYTLVATKENTEENIMWSSSDENVATVADGVVTALKVGTTTITAKAGEASDTCVVTVVDSTEESGGEEGSTDTKVELKSGNKAATNADPGNWYYMNDGKTTSSTPTIDEGNNIEYNIESVDSDNKKYAYLRYAQVDAVAYSVTISVKVAEVNSNVIEITGGNVTKAVSKTMAAANETWTFDYTADTTTPFQLKIKTAGSYTFNITFAKA